MQNRGEAVLGALSATLDGVQPYAILDGARDAAIYKAVTESGAPSRCLYAGALAPELAEAAPYLVHLRPDMPFARWLVRQAWGNAWGVFLLSDAPLDELHRHLRRFLRVKDEEGRRLYFRYYDPRVLRIYLPTCTEEELALFFGPVRAFLAEGETPDAMVRFTLEEGRLQATGAPLG